MSGISAPMESDFRADAHRGCRKSRGWRMAGSRNSDPGEQVDLILVLMHFSRSKFACSRIK